MNNYFCCDYRKTTVISMSLTSETYEFEMIFFLDSFNTDSPKGSMISVSGGRTSPKSRRRAKSVHIGSTLK